MISRRARLGPPANTNHLARRNGAPEAPTAVVRRALAITALGLLALAHGADAPAHTLLVRVRDADAARLLANAQVIERGGAFQRFTDARGELLIAQPDAQPLRLRVRQLGYVYVDTTIAPPASDRADRDTLVISLHRVAWQLGGVAVRVKRGCDAVRAPLLTAEALAQLRQGAERYLAFREEWPFEVRLARRTALLDGEGKPRRITDEREAAWSEEWGLPYQAGRLIGQNGAGFAIPLLFVTALADSAFLERHCFDARNVIEWRGHRVVRLSFWPDSTVDTPDWEGVALIDSATSLLRKVDFQVTGLANGHLPRRLEGYTTFSTPTALVAFPESTLAVWWRRGPDASGAWSAPDVAQILHVKSLDWRKRRPPPLEP